MIKLIQTSFFSLLFSLSVQAQNQEVSIEKKSTKKDTTSKKDSIEHFSVVVDGDNILINGQAADKFDPRLKKMKRIKIEKELADPIEEDDNFTMKIDAPTNKALLGVITEVEKEGAKIVEVNESSPAFKAGLKKDDIITKVNTDAISSPEDLFTTIGKYHPNDKVKVEYLRNGKKLNAEIVLAENKNINQNRKIEFFNFEPNQRNFNFKMPSMPKMDGMINGMKKPRLGISIEDVEEGNGVLIKAVTPKSPAEKAGLKVGDIITSLDKHEVKEVNDIKWEYFEPGQNILIDIIRNKEHQTIEVKIPKTINTADL